MRAKWGQLELERPPRHSREHKLSFHKGVKPTADPDTFHPEMFFWQGQWQSRVLVSLLICGPTPWTHECVAPGSADWFTWCFWLSGSCRCISQNAWEICFTECSQTLVSPRGPSWLMYPSSHLPCYVGWGYEAKKKKKVSILKCVSEFCTALMLLQLSGDPDTQCTCRYLYEAHLNIRVYDRLESPWWAMAKIGKLRSGTRWGDKQCHCCPLCVFTTASSE